MLVQFHRRLRYVVLLLCSLATCLSQAQQIQTLRPKQALSSDSSRWPERYYWIDWPLASDLIIGATTKRITVWNASDWQEVLSIEAETNSGRGIHIPNVAATTSGDRVGWIEHHSSESRAHIVQLPSGQEISAFAVHDGSNGLQLNAKGNRVAVVGWDTRRTVSVYSVPGGKQLCQFSPFQEDLLCLQFLGESDYLAVGGRDRDGGPCLFIYDSTTGASVSSSRWQQSVVSLSASTDGKTLISSGGDGTTKVFAVAGNGELAVRDTHQLSAQMTVTSGDASRLIASGNELTVWDLDAKQQDASIPIPGTSSMALSPDATKLAVTLRSGIPLPMILDVDSLKWAAVKPTRYRMADSELGNLKFSHDGKLIAMSVRGSALDVFSIESKQKVRQLSLRGVRFRDVPISPQMQIMYEKDDIIYSWSVNKRNGKPLLRLPKHSSVHSESWSEPNKWALQTSHESRNGKRIDRILVLDTDGEVVHQWVNTGRHSVATRLSPDPEGRYLAFRGRVGSSNVFVIDLLKKTELGRFHLPGGPIHFSPDSRYLVSGLSRLDVTTAEIVQLFPAYGKKDNRIAVSSRGTLLAEYRKFSNVVRVWDYVSGHLLFSVQQPDIVVTSIALSPQNDMLAAGTETGDLLLWPLPSSVSAHSQNLPTTRPDPELIKFTKPFQYENHDGTKVVVSSRQTMTRDQVEKALRRALTTIRRWEEGGSDE